MVDIENLKTLATQGLEPNGGGALGSKVSRLVGKEVSKIKIAQLVRDDSNCHGFTLAEVLITIGIIGIVAALTLPSVINKYKAKQLETAFKKSSSIITSALNDTLFEFGLKELSFKELCDGYSAPMACYQANSEFFEQINNYFLSRFIVQKKITDTMYNQLNRETILVTNYTGNKKTFGYGQQYGMNAGNTPWHSVNFLSDGSVISALAFFYHGASDGVSLTFDTNGPYRGPNRWGYDIFIITTGTWYKPCSKLDPGLENGNYNGRGCYEYALKNVNPDDITREYWKSLY